jgi:hypothetical protein
LCHLGLVRVRLTWRQVTLSSSHWPTGCSYLRCVLFGTIVHTRVRMHCRRKASHRTKHELVRSGPSLPKNVWAPFSSYAFPDGWKALIPVCSWPICSLRVDRYHGGTVKYTFPFRQMFGSLTKYRPTVLEPRALEVRTSLEEAAVEFEQRLWLADLLSSLSGLVRK